jgi:protein-disulfide isomerase
MREEAMQRTEVTGADWRMGPDNPAISLLEYGDFECPYCAMARPVLEALVMEEPDRTQLVFRHFPVTTIHPHAFLAAEAAEAAGAQQRFWEMHDRLFTHRHQLEQDDLLWHAGELNLDVERFREDLFSHRFKEDVRDDFREGLRDGVNGTPAIFINRLRYDGPRDPRSMRAAISLASQREAPFP